MKERAAGVKSVHVVITGRVQGVGYRAFVEDRARERGISGWVRNRSDGTVEAVFAGPAADIETLLSACDEGPRRAIVIDIVTKDYDGPPPTRFIVRPTE